MIFNIICFVFQLCCLLISKIGWLLRKVHCGIKSLLLNVVSFIMGMMFNNFEMKNIDSKDPVGLVNQGATCYLNSLLQCLFWTPMFKERILNKSTEGATVDSEIAKELECIFYELENQKYAVKTMKLTNCLKLCGGQQQDIAETFLLLLNKLDENIPAQEIFLPKKTMYKTTLLKSLECSICKKKDDTKCDLVLLPLALSSPSVSTSLEEFLSPKEMEKDNAIYCDGECQHKTNTRLTYKFTDLPPVLVLQLKRFEFDFSCGKFRKKDNLIDIPWTLQVRKECLCTPCRQLCLKKYELFAICNHYGSCLGGHYTARIKLQDSGWYEFDDERVTNLDMEINENKPLSSRYPYLLMYEQVGSSRNNSISRYQEKSKAATSTPQCLERGAGKQQRRQSCPIPLIEESCSSRDISGPRIQEWYMYSNILNEQQDNSNIISSTSKYKERGREGAVASMAQDRERRHNQLKIPRKGQSSSIRGTNTSRHFERGREAAPMTSTPQNNHREEGPWQQRCPCLNAPRHSRAVAAEIIVPQSTKKGAEQLHRQRQQCPKALREMQSTPRYQERGRTVAAEMTSISQYSERGARYQHQLHSCAGALREDKKAPAVMLAPLRIESGAGQDQQWQHPKALKEVWRQQQQWHYFHFKDQKWKMSLSHFSKH